MKFEIGYRVNHKEYGMGTVVYVGPKAAIHYLLVEFDKENSMLHDGSSSGLKFKQYHCWWCLEKDLTVIKNKKIKQSNLLKRIYLLEKRLDSKLTVIDMISKRVDKLEEKYKSINDLKIGDKVFICFDGKPEGSDTPGITSTMRTYNHKIGTVVEFRNFKFGESIKVEVEKGLPYFYHPDWLIKVEE